MSADLIICIRIVNNQCRRHADAWFWLGQIFSIRVLIKLWSNEIFFLENDRIGAKHDIANPSRLPVLSGIPSW